MCYFWLVSILKKAFSTTREWFLARTSFWISHSRIAIAWLVMIYATKLCVCAVKAADISFTVV